MKPERIMGDTEQVAIGQLLNCDGTLRQATQAGPISSQKAWLSAMVIRQPNLAARRGQLPMDEV